MKITFIVPTLVADLELRRCIDSINLVMQPTLQAYEILIVCPAFVFSAISLEYDAESIVVETRKGIYSAMNDGVRAAKGEYIYFIGKDDILLAGFREALNCLINGKIDLLSCDVYFGSNGVYSGNISKYKLLIKNLCHQGLIYKTDVIKKFGAYSCKMKIQADHFLNIKIIWSDENLKFFSLATPVCWYSNSGISTVVSDGVFWKLYPLILKKYVGKLAFILITAYRFLRGKK